MIRQGLAFTDRHAWVSMVSGNITEHGRAPSRDTQIVRSSTTVRGYARRRAGKSRPRKSPGQHLMARVLNPAGSGLLSGRDPVLQGGHDLAQVLGCFDGELADYGPDVVE